MPHHGRRARRALTRKQLAPPNAMNRPSEKHRLDTKLESEGAEFLVLGRMLLARIPTFKAYVNYPGYDLIAVDADKRTSVKIQVKSRFRTDWDGFIINNFKCDFVVFVALNRGFKYAKKSGETGVLEPQFYVLPIRYVRRCRDPRNKWGKIVRKRLANIEKYQDKWDSIRVALGSKLNRI